MRRLTLEEASTVSERSRDVGSRPSFYDASTRDFVEISSEFETYLILAPAQVKSDVSSLFQTVLDNDPNQAGLRSDVLTSFLDLESDNELERKRRFESLTSLYDDVRSRFITSIEGFEDLREVSLLQESLTTSLEGIVASRDRHEFNNAVIQVLKRRDGASGLSESRTESQAWVRVLTEYESNV